MTTHKVTLTDTEMVLVRWALNGKLDTLKELEREDKAKGLESSEFLKKNIAEIEKLYNKLTDPF